MKRINMLIGVLLIRSDDRHVCQRHWLREAYAQAWEQQDNQKRRRPTAPASGPPVFTGRTRNRVQGQQAGLRGAQFRKPGTTTTTQRRSTAALARDLRLLEDEGIVRRIEPDMVQVLDWTRLNAKIDLTDGAL